MDENIIKQILDDFEKMEVGTQFSIGELLRKYKVKENENDYWHYNNNILDKIKSQILFNPAKQFGDLSYNEVLVKKAVDKKTIVQLEYKSVAQISDGFYILKVKFLEDGLKIKLKGCWYEIEVKTEHNKDFILSTINALNYLDIENWDDYYSHSSTICATDLPSWELKIIYSNNEIKESGGYACYPKNWKIFQKILDRLVPIPIIKRLWD